MIPPKENAQSIRRSFQRQHRTPTRVVEAQNQCAYIWDRAVVHGSKPRVRRTQLRPTRVAPAQDQWACCWDRAVVHGSSPGAALRRKWAVRAHHPRRVPSPNGAGFRAGAGGRLPSTGACARPRRPDDQLSSFERSAPCATHPAVALPPIYYLARRCRAEISVVVRGGAGEFCPTGSLLRARGVSLFQVRQFLFGIFRLTSRTDHFFARSLSLKSRSCTRVDDVPPLRVFTHSSSARCTATDNIAPVRRFIVRCWTVLFSAIRGVARRVGKSSRRRTNIVLDLRWPSSPVPVGPSHQRCDSGRVLLQWTSRHYAALALVGARFKAESLSWAACIAGGSFPGPFPLALQVRSLRSLLLLLAHPCAMEGLSPPREHRHFALRRNITALSPHPRRPVSGLSQRGIMPRCPKRHFASQTRSKSGHFSVFHSVFCRQSRRSKFWYWAYQELRHPVYQNLRHFESKRSKIWYGPIREEFKKAKRLEKTPALNAAAASQRNFPSSRLSPRRKPQGQAISLKERNNVSSCFVMFRCLPHISASTRCSGSAHAVAHLPAQVMPWIRHVLVTQS